MTPIKRRKRQNSLIVFSHVKFPVIITRPGDHDIVMMI